jgi:hypothetical protein
VRALAKGGCDNYEGGCDDYGRGVRCIRAPAALGARAKFGRVSDKALVWAPRDKPGPMG